MGTNGFFGIKKGDLYKRCYTFYDANPSCLGVEVVKFINNNTIKEINDIYDNIVLVNMDDYPSRKQFDECVSNEFCDEKEFREEWHDLIRTPNDFDLNVYKKFRYMLDFDNKDSFGNNYNYWEYNYVINLNENTLDIYYEDQRNVYICFPLDDVNIQDMMDLEDDINYEEEEDYEESNCIVYDLGF